MVGFQIREKTMEENTEEKNTCMCKTGENRPYSGQNH